MTEIHLALSKFPHTTIWFGRGCVRNTSHELFYSSFGQFHTSHYILIEQYIRTPFDLLMLEHSKELAVNPIDTYTDMIEGNDAFYSI
jgi:hypothetical protein